MNVKGSCYVTLAYDIGFQIDLEACAKRLTVETERPSIAPRHRAPKHFEYRSKPLRLTQRAEIFAIAGFSSVEFVDLTLFEFGALSLTYRFPFSTGLDQLVDLSDGLYENKTLRADSEKRVVELLLSIRPAVNKPSISALVEDYVVFDIVRQPEDPLPRDVIEQHRATVAKILQSEKQALSLQEIDETLADIMSYSSNDCAIINWNSAFLIGEDSSDVRAVLEVVNVQLLEYRFLDTQLDHALEQAYDVMSKREGRRWTMLKPVESDLQRVARLQVDGALLFEGISNSLKLLGDQYLARLYQLAGKEFHLPDWDRAINRKLTTLQSIYDKIEDRINSLRMEVLEVVIILLILISIILPFIVSSAK